MAKRPPSPEDFAFSSLTSYAVYQWPGYRVSAHHHRIARALEAVERGEVRRLVINMPPRHGKSMLASEYFPAWYLGRNPERHIIHATYAQELAEDFGRKVRNQLADPIIYPAVFPGVAMRDDSASAKRFNTTHGGVYYALGVGGAATGRGAHLLLIDDPLKGREEADSETIRRKLKDWYTAVAYTRLMPDSAIVIICTRWHEDDLAGWQLREFAHERWQVLSLPAINDAGEALWPSDYPIERLMQIKRTVGTRDWSALYQQRPVPQEGGIWKLPWFRRYGAPPAAPEAYMVVQSWDTAYKAQQINDPSVCTTWLVGVHGYYLLHVWRGHADYPTLRRTAINLALQWQPGAILIEDKASGQSLIQELREVGADQTGGLILSVIAIEPDADKISRANAVSPLIESQRVYLPEQADWLIDYEAEIGSFPLASHDDQVDSTSQALRWMRDHACRGAQIYTSGEQRVGLGTGSTPQSGAYYGNLLGSDTTGFI